MNPNEFPAFMNKLARSQELVIEKIIKTKEGTFGDKIKFLERKLSGIDAGFDTSCLIKDLREFNKYWNITKHGSEVANFPFNYFKAGKITVFGESLRKKIVKNFEDCQKKLISLNNMLKV